MAKKMKLLYFFGAGLAKACGFPTTLELNTSFLRYLKSKGDKKTQIIEELNAIISKYPKQNDKIDIEEIYTFVSNMRTVDYFTEDYPDPINKTYLNLFYQFDKQQLYETFKKDIEQHIEDTFWNQDMCKPNVLRTLFPAEFIRNNVNDISIFTTNYDLAVESLFNSSKMSDILNTGVDYRDKTFDSKNFTKRVRKIPYVKLHGSIDLFIDNQDVIRQTDVPISNFGKKIKYGILPRAYYINYPFLGEPDKEYDKHQRNLLNFFDKKIKEAKYIIIIGTTLRDNFIKNIINKNLKHKNLLLIGNTECFYNRLPKIKTNTSNKANATDNRFPDGHTIEIISEFIKEFDAGK